MSGQTSGSISLDTSGLARQVVEAIRPIMTQINDNMTLLAGLLASTALDRDDAVDLLAYLMPAGTRAAQHGDGRSVSGHLADCLARAGYALVAVGGPAREAAERASGIDTGQPVAALQPLVAPSAAQAAREDEWFDVTRSD